ncbi:hypothetical protein SS05631_c30220 [Sinorhizobium sp. CCBAU 05631]|nr:hypothetical protein SS05631_c30220 [Sinorhizobium sp. CCBAU 05631]
MEAAILAAVAKERAEFDRGSRRGTGPLAQVLIGSTVTALWARLEPAVTSRLRLRQRATAAPIKQLLGASALSAGAADSRDFTID